MIGGQVRCAAPFRQRPTSASSAHSDNPPPSPASRGALGCSRRVSHPPLWRPPQGVPALPPRRPPKAKPGFHGRSLYQNQLGRFQPCAFKQGPYGISDHGIAS
jgi:hypothetical protein